MRFHKLFEKYKKHDKDIDIKEFKAAYLAALSNTNICRGTASNYDLTNWFGNSIHIEEHEIVAAQAFNLALETCLMFKAINNMFKH